MLAEAHRRDSFRFDAHALGNITQKQVYVLVIGEASRADHWQLFGYPRPTNPELDKIPNLIQLPDIVTPWSASRMSVPIIVSRRARHARPLRFQRAIDHPGIFRSRI